jgi:uncharacterized protein (DUF1330 family)
LGEWAATVPSAGALSKTDRVVASGRVIALVGEAPKRFGVSEWESVEKAQAYYTSEARKALDAQRAKALKVTRQFIVERLTGRSRSDRQHAKTAIAIRGRLIRRSHLGSM